MTPEFQRAHFLFYPLTSEDEKNKCRRKNKQMCSILAADQFCFMGYNKGINTVYSLLSRLESNTINTHLTLFIHLFVCLFTNEVIKEKGQDRASDTTLSLSVYLPSLLPPPLHTTDRRPAFAYTRNHCVACISIYATVRVWRGLLYRQAGICSCR